MTQIEWAGLLLLIGFILLMSAVVYLVWPILGWGTVFAVSGFTSLVVGIALARMG